MKYVVKDGYGRYLQGYSLVDNRPFWTTCQRCAVKYNRADAHEHAHDGGCGYRVSKIVRRKIRS